MEDCWRKKWVFETSTWRRETPLLGAASQGIYLEVDSSRSWPSMTLILAELEKIRSFLSGSWALSILVSIHEFYLFVRISSKTCPCSILDAFIFLDLNNCIITSISYTLFWMLFGYTNIGGPLKIQRPYNLIQSVC